MSIHTEPHPLAGKTVKIKASSRHPQVETFGGSELRLEDWWDRVTGKSWMTCGGNPACVIYALRQQPIDNEIVYGKIGSFGHLVHVSELEEGNKP